MDWNAILVAFFNNSPAIWATAVVIVALLIANAIRRIDYLHHKTATTKHKLELDDAFRRVQESNKFRIEEAKIHSTAKVKNSLDSFDNKNHSESVMPHGRF